MAENAWENKVTDHTASTNRKQMQREKKLVLSSHTLLFILFSEPEFPAHGKVPITFRVDLPCSVKPSCKCLRGYSLKSVFPGDSDITQVDSQFNHHSFSGRHRAEEMLLSPLRFPKMPCCSVAQMYQSAELLLSALFLVHFISGGP